MRIITSYMCIVFSPTCVRHLLCSQVSRRITCTSHPRHKPKIASLSCMNPPASRSCLNVVQATTDDLKQAIFDDKDRNGKYSPVRQRLTLPPEPGAKAGTALGAGQSLKSYGLETGAVVQYKDLGMQVFCLYLCNARSSFLRSHLVMHRCMTEAVIIRSW